MGEPPGLPENRSELLVREYRGFKYVAEDLADEDAERLAQDGWWAASAEWFRDAEGMHPLVRLLDRLRMGPDEYVLRVTYDRGQPRHGRDPAGPGAAAVGQEQGSTAPWSRGQSEALLTSRGLGVGAAIVMVSALLGASGAPDLALAVGLTGYVVAGALAPPHPFVTGLLLALLHGVTAMGLDQLIERAPPGDGLAAIGAAVFGMVYAAIIVFGAFLTGIVGHLAGWLRTRGQ